MIRVLRAELFELQANAAQGLDKVAKEPEVKFAPFPVEESVAGPCAAGFNF